MAPLTGTRWLCVGDAAMSFEPLSSKGTSNALYTGMLAGGTVRQSLSSNESALHIYSVHLKRIHAVHMKYLHQFYCAERRLIEAPFWRRRHAGPV